MDDPNHRLIQDMWTVKMKPFIVKNNEAFSSFVWLVKIQLKGDNSCV